MVDLSLVKPQDLWYVVGLIATDGSLSSDNRHITITSKDRKFLYSIRKTLLLNNKIGRKGNGGNKEKVYSTLQIGDVKFYKWLLGIGLTKKKSLTMRQLKIPNEYFLDFFRGVIDGDGNISTWKHRTNNHIQWSLRVVSAAPVFLKWLKKEIESHCEVGGKMYGYKFIGKKNYLYSLKFGKFAAKTILKLCYYDGCTSLNRKLKKSLKCIESKDGLSKYGAFKSMNYVRPSAGIGRQPTLKMS